MIYTHFQRDLLQHKNRGVEFLSVEPFLIITFLIIRWILSRVYMYFIFEEFKDELDETRDSFVNDSLQCTTNFQRDVLRRTNRRIYFLSVEILDF